MNRAWIPAGALASVSVAGLLALGPLTDSMGTKVSFPTSVQAPSGGDARTTNVPVKFDVGTAGSTETAADFKPRGGASTQVTPNVDAGLVGYRRVTSPTGSVTKTTTKTTKKATAKQAKKKAKRASIGSVGETPNGDSGLTSGATGGKTDVGEQAPTPANDAP